MRRIEWVAVVVLVVVGAYLLIFHRDPLPLNHEAVGLGTLHAVHDVIGLVLPGVAGLIWWRSRRSARPVAARAM